MLYLTINLAKGVSGLNTQELGIALSSIDAVSASISMAFSDKDVLAARKLVSFGFLTQLVAYVVQAIAFSAYTQRDKPQCGSPTPYQLSSQHYSTAYWIYLAFRIAASIFPCQVAYRLTSSLNKIENKYNATRSTRVKATALWRSLPATLATSYLIYWSFVLLHGLSIFNILRGTNTIGQSWHSLTSEWGQSANAIIAVFAICHVAYAVYRLFVAESTNDDVQTPEHSGRSISRAYPQRGWMAWKHWPWTKPRWPFHLGLDYSDHLLIDESMLQRVLNPPLEMDPEVRKKLWQDLMDGFTYNDLDGILDCLDQGAPVDEPNDDGNWPVHLAARYNNTDILMKTRFKSTEGTTTYDSLLQRNLAQETPLEIACNTGTLEAVRWIMERLPQEDEEANAAVYRAFKSTISSEKEGVLKILQHLWPAEKALKMRTEVQESAPLNQQGRKRKPTLSLIDPAILVTTQSRFQETFELAWKIPSTYLMRCVLEPQVMSEAHTPGISRSIMNSSLSDSMCLELLQNLGFAPRELLFCAVKYAVNPSASNPRACLWETIMLDISILTPELSDSVLTESMLLSEISQEGEVARLHIAQIFGSYGGRDWSAVVKASTEARPSDLQHLVDAESDSSCLQRMLNVKNARGHTLLDRTIERPLHRTETQEKQRQRLQCIDLLLKHGSLVRPKNLTRAYERSSAMSFAVFMLLVAYSDSETLSRALHKVCSTDKLHEWKEARGSFQKIQALLRGGADPTIMNKFHCTPRDNVLLIIKDDSYAKESGTGTSSPVDGAVSANQIAGKYLLKTYKLLQRWENYPQDPSCRKPSEDTDEDWKAFSIDLTKNLDDWTWTWLVEKNPEGYKVVDD